MYYFGTNLTSAGHFYFKINGGFASAWDLPESKDYLIPFNPYYIKSKPKGTTDFFQIYGYTGIAISGSCTDTRGGTVSVFFVKENISKEEFMKRLNCIPTAQDILKAMPFDVIF